MMFAPRGQREHNGLPTTSSTFHQIYLDGRVAPPCGHRKPGSRCVGGLWFFWYGEDENLCMCGRIMHLGYCILHQTVAL